MEYDGAPNSTVEQAMDQGRKATEKAGQAVKDGYKAAQQYAEDKGLNFTSATWLGANRG
jgi:hypothetical protein